jgi:hypothetical protein
MKRRLQEKIYEETKDMTPEQEIEHIRRGAERFRAETAGMSGKGRSVDEQLRTPLQRKAG